MSFVCFEVAFQLLYFVCKSLAEVVTTCLWCIIAPECGPVCKSRYFKLLMRIEIGILQYFLTLLLPTCDRGGKSCQHYPRRLTNIFLLKLTLSNDLYCIKIFLLI